MKRSIILTAIVAAFISICCSSSTEITGSWKNPALKDKKYNNVFVAAFTKNINAKTTVEGDLASALQKKGTAVSRSIQVMPPNFTDSANNKEAMLKKIRKTEANAILTISLIDKETESRYVPGSYGYQPYPRFGYYGMFWGYYSYWYPQVYSPGYYVEDKTYYIETNLYDAKTEEVVWSAQSATYNPANLQRFSKEFASVIADRLSKEGLL